MKKNKGSKIITLKPRHGTVLAMVSIPNEEVSTTLNFQNQCQHCVPKRAGPTSGRYSVTIRSSTPSKHARETFLGETFSKVFTIVSPKESDCPCYVTMSQSLLDSADVDAIYAELVAGKDQMTPDRTFVYGKWHENAGRLVQEMAWTAGQTYRYGGKTTPAGIAFPNTLRRVVQEVFAPIFNVEPKHLWAHIVYYPDNTCGLAWHSDAEEGIDPHLIMSITFLDNGRVARDFQVRKIK